MATADQIKQEIIEWVNTEQGYTYGPDEINRAFWQFHESLDWRDTVIDLPSGTTKKVEGQDAGEGDYSADTYIVFSVNDQIFRVDGHYESWDGSEWYADNLYEAAPTPVTTIQYLRK